MESLRDDIRSKKTLNSIREMRDIIIDCATNIKSNDATFKISTLPEVGDKLSSLMSDYIDTVQKLEATQSTFTKLEEEIDDANRQPPEEQEEEEEVIDLGVFEQKFKDIYNKENETVTEEAEGLASLEAVLRLPRVTRQEQQDEDIQVESPSRQIPKDPITKKDIKVAVRNSKCNHIYDRGSIDNYIAQKEKSKSRVQCPVAGCQNRNMKKTELINDEETNNLIASLREQNDL